MWHVESVQARAGQSVLGGCWMQLASMGNERVNTLFSYMCNKYPVICTVLLINPVVVS